MSLFGSYHYFAVVVLMVTGLYVVMVNSNLVKKVLGLNLLQTSVFVFYISLGKLDGGTAPILAADFTRYANPLPHVLILTAIVVGVATTALALSLIVRIHRGYGSVEEEEIAGGEQDAPWS